MEYARYCGLILLIHIDLILSFPWTISISSENFEVSSSSSISVPIEKNSSELFCLTIKSQSVWHFGFDLKVSTFFVTSLISLNVIAIVDFAFNPFVNSGIEWIISFIFFFFPFLTLYPIFDIFLPRWGACEIVETIFCIFCELNVISLNFGAAIVPFECDTTSISLKDNLLWWYSNHNPTDVNAVWANIENSVFFCLNPELIFVRSTKLVVFLIL